MDVHAHLIHPKFEGIEDSVSLKCIDKGLDHVIVNGLEPISNRKVLDLCQKHRPYLLPALGIYPLDAACHMINASNWTHDFDPPVPFDIEAELSFIEQKLQSKEIVAIGECGMDRHYLTDETALNEQERVLRRLAKVNKG